MAYPERACWDQVWAAVGEFSDWTHVVSSPLQRCHHFAETVAERYRMHASYAGRIRLRRTARGIELWFGH